MYPELMNFPPCVLFLLCAGMRVTFNIIGLLENHLVDGDVQGCVSSSGNKFQFSSLFIRVFHKKNINFDYVLLIFLNKK